MKRTDLALEAYDLCRRGRRNEQMHGVRAETKRRGPVCTTVVQILDAEGERAMGKARGTYVSMELQDRSVPVCAEAAAELAGHLRRLVPAEGSVLVAGLGNRAVTPDALGALTAQEVLVTAHLSGDFPFLRPVYAVCPGVKGQTGLESGEAVRALASLAKPVCVIAVDALAASELGHIGTVVQLSDAGIQPGSGVGNRTEALNEETLGVPVLALGVPMVADLAESGAGRIVTAADVDAVASGMAKLLGAAINQALQSGLTKGELDEFLM